MTLTIETDLKEVFNKIDQRLDKIDQRLEGVQKDITDIKLDLVGIKGDIKVLDNKGSIIQPIITGLTVAFAGGLLLAIYKWLPS